MTAYDFVVRIADEFHHSVGLVHGESLAVGTEEPLLACVFQTELLAAVFTQTYGCCFRIGEYGRRHYVGTNVVRQSEHVVHYVQALECGGMCKHALTVHVAYGIYARHVGGEVVVGMYAFSVEFDACLLESYAFGIRSATGGYEYSVGLNVERLAFFLDYHVECALSVLTGFLFYLFHGSLHVECYSALADGLAQALCNVAVECRQGFFHEFNDCYLTSETAECRSKLHAYDSCTDNAQTFRGCFYL